MRGTFSRRGLKRGYPFAPPMSMPGARAASSGGSFALPACRPMLSFGDEAHDPPHDGRSRREVGLASLCPQKGRLGLESVSFAESRERSREFAAWLVSKGFEKGDRLAIVAEGRPRMGRRGKRHALRGLRSGTPLSIKLLAEEIPFRLDHSEAKAILDEQESDREDPRLLRVARRTPA